MSHLEPLPEDDSRASLRERIAGMFSACIAWLTQPPQGDGKLARWRPWILAGAAFTIALVAAITLWGKLRSDVWAYYTDGDKLKAGIHDEKARPVLWEDPRPHRFAEDPDAADPEEGSPNAPTGQLEAAFSADGTMMVLVRWKDNKSDMYLSQWDGRVWSQPRPMESVNTEANERGPALSRDGRYLYFATDRKGGIGGYDLYMARWDGREWTGIETLPAAVNSSADELGPALSADDSQLYFSSDRDSEGSEDIFVSNIKGAEAKQEEKRPEKGDKRKPRGKRNPAEIARAEPGRKIPLAPFPEYSDAEPVDDLNSKAADVQAALTKRGDHVFLASDRDRGKKTGFKVYISRVIDGEAKAPQEVDLYIEEGDVTDPAVRMEGFDLLFSTSQPPAEEPETLAEGEGPGYLLYQSTTREVIGYTDLSRWEQFKELMGNIAWWILLALAALIALIYILEKWQDITSLFHKCLAASGIAHLLALLLAMVWMIAKEIEDSEEAPFEDLVVNIDALAEEELALESIPQETAITDASTNIESEKVESEFGAPGFEARDEQQPVEAAQTSKESLLVEAQPTQTETDQALPEPPTESSVLNELAETALPEVDKPVLDERDFSEPETVADTSAETFAPEVPEPEMTAQTQAEPPTPQDTPSENATAAPTEVTENRPPEPLEDAPKESVVEVAAAAADQPEPTPTEAQPLESAMLAALPDSSFVDPSETQFEENTPAENANPADTSADVFNPNNTAVEFTSAPTQSETVADAPMNTAADAAQIAPGEPAAAASSAVNTEPAEVGEAGANVALVPDNFEPFAGGGLPDSALPSPEAPTLPEANPAAGGGPANPTEDIFNPDAGSANLATAPAQSQNVADAAKTAAADAAQITPAEMVAGSPTIQALPPEVTSGTPTNALPPSPIEPALPGSLPPVDLPEVGGPQLPEANNPPGAAPANPANDTFNPSGAATALNTTQAANQAVADAAKTAAADAATVTGSAAAPESSAVEARPPELPTSASTSALPPSPLEPAPLGGLPAPELIDPGAPALPEGNAPPGAQPADSSKDTFTPGGAVPNLVTSKADGQTVADTAATTDSDAAAVGGGALVPATTAVETRPPEVGESRPSNAIPPPNPSQGMLPDSTPIDPGSPTLPEPGGGGPPADTSGQQFTPGGSVPNLATSKAGGTAVADSALTNQAAATSVAGSATQVGAPAELVANTMESNGSMPSLAVGGTPSPLDSPVELPTPGLPNKLEAPPGLSKADIAKEIQKQRGKPGLETIKQMGGDEGTEGAIGSAIQWLVKNQEKDGRWDTRKHGANNNYDTGGTGLALLCFYGWGERHDRKCKYQKNVRDALEWLLDQQKEDGYLGGRPGMMYSHAIAAIALCEAYGITKDAKLKKPAEKAIAYTLAAQSKSKGGWRYTPGEDSDTSVTGWQFMAMHSARMAGLEVPEENFERARKFLDTMGGGKHGGLYGYQERGKLSRAMVATGMFCRQLDLEAPSTQRQQESARLLKLHPMKTKNPDIYYVYYATLALYQHQGPVWTEWNKRLKETLPLIQKKSGNLTGSWDPSSSMTKDGGRVVSTTMATLSLEVYYRLLPMYGFRNQEAKAPEVEKR